MTEASTCCSDTWLDLPSRSPAHTQPYTQIFFFGGNELYSVTAISSERDKVFFFSITIPLLFVSMSLHLALWLNFVLL